MSAVAAQPTVFCSSITTPMMHFLAFYAETRNPLGAKQPVGLGPTQGRILGTGSEVHNHRHTLQPGDRPFQTASVSTCTPQTRGPAE